MRKPRVLIIDDERNFRDFLGEALRAEGYDVSAAATARAGLLLAREEHPHVVLLDQKLPDRSGLDLLPELKTLVIDPVVIVVTAHAEYARAVEAIKAGAFQYITKPFEFSDLLSALAEASVDSSAEQNDGARDALASIVGSSESIRDLKQQIRRIATSPVATVLLRGESGTGKELVARAIHRLSRRAGEHIVSINCAALTETLLMSELFGHERGAFTDARAEKKGVFEAANRGTLLLDEISEMGPRAQAALLRVLEQRVISRVGGTKEIPVDVRIVAATNRPLDAHVAAGTFRADLYYRLNVVEVEVAPLRERGADIVLLARHFSRTVAQRYGEPVRKLTPEAEARLLTHSWPGNVRELRNAIERVYVVGKHAVIEPAHLRLSTPAMPPLAFEVDSTLDVEFQQAKRRLIDRFEQRYLARALARAGGNITRAAEIAGMYRQVFQRLLNRHKIDSSDFRDPRRGDTD